jgi:hypothetical protein
LNFCSLPAYAANLVRGHILRLWDDRSLWEIEGADVHPRKGSGSVAWLQTVYTGAESLLEPLQLALATDYILVVPLDVSSFCQPALEIPPVDLIGGCVIPTVTLLLSQRLARTN